MNRHRRSSATELRKEMTGLEFENTNQRDTLTTHHVRRVGSITYLFIAFLSNRVSNLVSVMSKEARLKKVDKPGDAAVAGVAVSAPALDDGDDGIAAVVGSQYQRSGGGRLLVDGKFGVTLTSGGTSSGQ
ncbi:hypothetical protein OIU79_023655 [Salix purpurea]|uniref:Uncharacterized protein n=1 Tax=Salix purpurea TaxID=77065 RepID=A0A9Q0W9L4_SALPP|nr:hypothetical protein OIU79_023655 [Salix purpurea]